MSLIKQAIRFENELNKKTLFQNLMRIAIIACIVTLIAEFFLPLGKTYYFTVLVLISSLIALALHLKGLFGFAYHFILISIPIGFYVILLLINKPYPSITHLYTLGIVFSVAFVPRKTHIILYFIFFTVMHLLQTSRYFIATDHYTNWSEYLYDSIHIVAYSLAIFIITIYFIRFINKQKNDISILRLENENAMLELKIKYQEELIEERAANVNQFLSGQEAERKRISQALHDGVNSRLTSLKVLVSNSDSENKNLIVKDLDSIGFDVRSISHALNPHTLRFQGLKGAIEEEIFKIESNNLNIQFTFEYDASIDELDKGYLDILYYSTLEFLQNTLKHSEATEVKIIIECDNNKVILEYYDNGEPIKNDNLKLGLGLKNIESNSKLYNGSFVIEIVNELNLQKLTLLRS